MRRTAAISFLVLGLTMGSRTASAQAIQEVLTPDVEISRDYETWSLFLICNDSWARRKSPERLQTLWREFSSFGNTIGLNPSRRLVLEASTSLGYRLAV